MPHFRYSFKHKHGDGGGVIEAENQAAAQKKVTAQLKEGETDDNKLTSLKVEIGEEVDVEE